MPTWDELFQQEKHRWPDPHQMVVDFARALLQRGVEQVLDLGCGAGRHTVYLTQMGFTVFATDLSEIGLSVTRSRLCAEGGSADLYLADMSSTALADSSIDAVICLYVIYHAKLERVRHAVAEIERVLRPGGIALVTLISTRGYRYGRGREIEPDTFLPDTGPDTSLPHHFFDNEGSRDLLRRFDVASLFLDENIEESDDGRQLLHSHWVGIVEKVSKSHTDATLVDWGQRKA